MEEDIGAVCEDLNQSVDSTIDYSKKWKSEYKEMQNYDLMKILDKHKLINTFLSGISGKIRVKAESDAIPLELRFALDELRNRGYKIIYKK